MIAREDRERVLIVITFAVENNHFKRYLSWLKTRKFMIDLWKNSKYDEAALNALKEKNIRFINPWEEIKNESGLGLENFDYRY